SRYLQRRKRDWPKARCPSINLVWAAVCVLYLRGFSRQANSRCLDAAFLAGWVNQTFLWPKAARLRGKEWASKEGDLKGHAPPPGPKIPPSSARSKPRAETGQRNSWNPCEFL